MFQPPQNISHYPIIPSKSFHVSYVTVCTSGIRVPTCAIQGSHPSLWDEYSKLPQKLAKLPLTIHIHISTLRIHNLPTPYLLTYHTHEQKPPLCPSCCKLHRSSKNPHPARQTRATPCHKHLTHPQSRLQAANHQTRLATPTNSASLPLQVFHDMQVHSDSASPLQNAVSCPPRHGRGSRTQYIKIAHIHLRVASHPWDSV
jgi:hypothetical protein